MDRKLIISLGMDNKTKTNSPLKETNQLFLLKKVMNSQTKEKQTAMNKVEMKFIL